ncbi:hypothetical protein G7K_0146-t1 [Saitoella complicata NRRL Y-17804]|uniref:Uncharacterized protein n=1 Tax=Saitoella complicata (strain BCRC 22490 / CBS 7301 / JCM 7358 / NBRC 10748 / NRRL Y-17804) TaxID=698492 RepID=A0A0E9N935_SAICN|nr:hypothetical protein G7K_0146-t1 [Saitoella complicata NRRL Y-17804]
MGLVEFIKDSVHWRRQSLEYSRLPRTKLGILVLVCKSHLKSQERRFIKNGSAHTHSLFFQLCNSIVANHLPTQIIRRQLNP